MLGVFALGLVLDEQSYREAERYCSENPAQCNASESSAIVGSPAPAESQPVTSQPQWWERSDLDAQRKMARWTTIIGVLTGGGIILLGWTLWETRRLTVETQRIGEAQVRAYLSIKSAKVLPLPEQLFPLVEFEIHNHGQSPARNVRVDFDFLWGFELVEQHGGSKDFYRSDIGAGETHVFRVRFVDSKRPYEVVERCKGNPPPSVFVEGTLHYDDVFEKEQIMIVYYSALITKPGYNGIWYDMQRVSVRHTLINQERAAD